MADRAPDFRYIFANSVGFGLNDNEVRIVFGMAEDLTKPAESTELAGVVMTHRTAKLLWYILDQALKSYEQHLGVEIPLDEAKKEALSMEMQPVKDPALTTASSPPSSQSPPDAPAS